MFEIEYDLVGLNEEPKSSAPAAASAAKVNSTKKSEGDELVKANTPQESTNGKDNKQSNAKPNQQNNQREIKKESPLNDNKGSSVKKAPQQKSSDTLVDCTLLA
jgi:hypothetical protein